MSIKKGKRGKRIAAALSICMVLGIASTAGCGKSADNSDSTGNETVQTETDAASAASSEQGKQVELKVEVFDRGVQGQLPVDNNYWTPVSYTHLDVYKIQDNRGAYGKRIVRFNI